MFRGLFQKIDRLITGRGKIDDELYDELEELLIQADVSVHTTTRIVEELRQATRRNRLSTAEDVRAHLQQELAAILSAPDGELARSESPPTVYLIVGVNGTGKTTTIAKLAYRLTQQGQKGLLAAADTFRAAAIDQLEVWARRVGLEVVKHQEGADPGAVVYDAVQAARARRLDFLIVDTAGRLHTKVNLMEELKKLHRIVQRELGRPPDEVLLVLDGTVGQNAISQAKSFGDALGLTGIVLTKLDGTARGGVVITIKDELKIPIKLVGTGEKLPDLDVFRPEPFVAALFEETPEADGPLPVEAREPVPESPVPEPQPWAEPQPVLKPKPEPEPPREPEPQPEAEPEPAAPTARQGGFRWNPFRRGPRE
jgi:fused signal recognition particle receptor